METFFIYTFIDLLYASEMEESGFSNGVYLIFHREQYRGKHQVRLRVWSCASINAAFFSSIQLRQDIPHQSGFCLTKFHSHYPACIEATLFSSLRHLLIQKSFHLFRLYLQLDQYIGNTHNQGRLWDNRNQQNNWQSMTSP